MRPTWIVVGLVLGIGTIAYWKLRQQADETPPPEAAPTPATPAGRPSAPVLLKGEARGEEPAAQAPATAAETRARALLQEVSAAHAARDRAAYDRAVAALQKEAWDAPSARRFAVKLGWAELQQAEALRGAERMQRLDRARRYLSRGVWLPELFGEGQSPTPERERLVQAIQQANRQVMTFAAGEGGGLAGITRPYKVPGGESPILTVSRQKLPYGPNAILYWNKGDLDPRKVQRDEVLLLPAEPLHVEVSLERRRLAIFIGDWLVKEWPVGVGRPESPTPAGSFHVGVKREENPNWWSPKGKIPPGDPENELGSMWIGICGESLPEGRGIGLHGTNKPHTVGTECSNGCVRMANELATELYRWVRGKDSNGGEPTRIEIF